jgi:hypothetical protein
LFPEKDRKQRFSLLREMRNATFLPDIRCVEWLLDGIEKQDVQTARKLMEMAWQYSEYILGTIDGKRHSGLIEKRKKEALQKGLVGRALIFQQYLGVTFSPNAPDAVFTPRRGRIIKPMITIRSATLTPVHEAAHYLALKGTLKLREEFARGRSGRYFQPL